MVLFFSGTAFCQEDPEELRKLEQARIQEKIEKHQVIIQKLHQGLESQEVGVEESLEKEKGILAEIETIDLKLFKMTTRLEELNSKMKNQETLIEEKENQLRELTERRQRVQNHLQKRMIAYYKLGKIDLINITFSTQTLPDMLRFHDSFRDVIKYDQAIIAQYRRSIQELRGIKESLTLEKALLEEFISQAAEEEHSIREVRAEKENLLDRVRTQAELHRQALNELQEAKEDLDNSLKNLKEQSKIFDQGFLFNKGSHIPPVSGTIISLFKQRITNRFGITRNPPGIAINAPDGTKVHAIYTGVVIFSGYLRGYGNTVIIDHGYGYFSVTSRLERLLVKKGMHLQRNSIIGIMGSTATLLDEGLYFEIRLKDTPVDPLHWLAPENLTFTRGLKDKAYSS